MCDGYGIWGGGGNNYGNRSIAVGGASNRLSWSIRALPGSTIGNISPDEKASFEWFTVRAIKKLPGSFGFAFWDTLIFQAVSNERAILHAVLAVSSTHKKAALDGAVLGSDTTPDEYERFALRQYSKSIDHLQPHFSATNDRAAIRVMLVACVVFTSLESLRGYYVRGSIHLRNGFKLLQEYLTLSTVFIDNLPSLRLSRDSTDDRIIEAFTRLYVQAKLLGQSFEDLQPIPCVLATKPIPILFKSFNEARMHLDHILSSIIHLTEQCRGNFAAEVNSSNELLNDQSGLKSRLSMWHAVFEASVTSLQASMTLLDSWARRLLRLYYRMACIMVETCLWSSCESVYDQHTNHFIAILMHAIEAWKSFTDTSPEELLVHQGEVFKCTLDIGWTPPLYYTALKCRVHRIRLHAVRLIDSVSHKAGIWDTMLTTEAARKVLEIEEGDFYANFEKRDGFLLGSAPENQDMKLRMLPESCRVRDVQVALPDGPAGTLILTCTRKGPGDIQEAIVKEYDLVSQRWKG